MECLMLAPPAEAIATAAPIPPAVYTEWDLSFCARHAIRAKGNRRQRCYTWFGFLIRPATTWSSKPATFCCSVKEIRRMTLKNIFVGNLDFGATESSIRALFENY